MSIVITEKSREQLAGDLTLPPRITGKNEL